MLRKFVCFLLALSGRTHVSRFLESIFSLGTRGEVLASGLLFDQGLWVLFSGANTTAALQTSGRFVLPFWLERQWNPNSRSFLPTGAGLLTCNLTHRNWTSLGLPGEPVEVIVDPVGMVTPRVHGASFLPYMRVAGCQVLPPRENDVSQEFELERREVITRFSTCAEVNLESRVSVALWENAICALVEVRVTNISLEKRAVDFGVALRPYNPLAVGHVKSLCRTSDSTLEIEGIPSLIAVFSPDQVIAGSRNQGDPLETGSGFNLEKGRILNSDSGLLFVNFEYRRVLDSQKTDSVFFVLPAISRSPKQESFTARSISPWDFELKQKVWKKSLLSRKGH